MLTEVKTLLGISQTDYSQDDRLLVILDMTESRLKTLLGTDEVPGSLSFIVDEVCVKRFNRIGSEGYSAHTVEGESISLGKSDFDDYLPEIEAWKDAQTDPKKAGRIRFI